jgi:CubicO group peptidase (beta-lactamase class C family)
MSSVDTLHTVNCMLGIESYIEDQRERFGVPGMSVAVTRGEDVVLERGFGTRDGSNDVSPDTLFALASTTKAFTATLCAALVDDGLAQWDTPIREYLPRFRMKDPVASELLTIRDLLCHRSGLPRHDALMYADVTSTRAQIVESLQYLAPSRPFREAWQYNNLMFVAAGYLAGELMGTTWEDAVRTRLLAPLGMHNTNFSVTDSQAAADFALPHMERDGKVGQIPFLNLDVGGPAGSINSCASDMTRWLMVNANGGVFDSSAVISPAALAQLHAPAMVLPAGALVSWDEAYPTAYALGWIVESYRGQRLVHHTGHIDGFSAFVAVLPAQHSGVVVLANMDDSYLTTAVGYRALDELLGLEPLPWADRFFDLETTLRTATTDVKQHRAETAKRAAPTFALDAYAATYRDDGYGDVTISTDEGGLRARYKGLQFSMRHRHYDTWDLRIDELDVTVPAKFEADFEGNVTTLVLPLEPAVAPIRFTRQAAADLSSPERLAKCTGRFVLGPLSVSVALVDDQLVATQEPGGTTLHLVPVRDWTFSAVEAPHMSLEFASGDEDDRATRLFARAFSRDTVLTRV